MFNSSPTEMLAPVSLQPESTYLTFNSLPTCNVFPLFIQLKVVKVQQSPNGDDSAF
jgi:hypothetical protein